VDVVDLTASSPSPERFPPVAVLGGREDDHVAKCIITMVARHEALCVAAADASRGYPEVFGETLSKHHRLTAAGAPIARFAHTGIGSRATTYSTL
jgi:hypothetical protein